MRNYRRKNRDEFDWEQEIRRDEMRISRYYRELAYCLDLPGEDEIIYEQLSGRCSDPVPTAAGEDPLRQHFFDRDDEDGDEENQPHHQSVLVGRIDRLAASWCVLSASVLDRRFFVPGGLAVACAYAKLLARVSDFADADPVTERALCLSLAKRALADVNELLGAMYELSSWQKQLKAELGHHISGLFFIREELAAAISRD